MASKDTRIFKFWNRRRLENSKLMALFFQETEDTDLLHRFEKLHFDLLINKDIGIFSFWILLFLPFYKFLEKHSKTKDVEKVPFIEML